MDTAGGSMQVGLSLTSCAPVLTWVERLVADEVGEHKDEPQSYTQSVES